MKNLTLKKKSLGQGMTEYIIITALIAIAAIAAYSFFGQTIQHQVAGMAAEMSGTDAQAEINASKGAAAASAANAAKTTNLGNYNESATKATGGAGLGGGAGGNP